MTDLFTIGYEGTTLPDFLRCLAQAEVRVLVDVREMPLSRRKGFSKTALAAVLKTHSIRYIHCKALGAPKKIRDELRATGDYARYFRRFNAYLATQTEALSALATECYGAVALMCYERDPRECHRSSVARELGKMTDLVPVNLEVGRHGSVHEAPRVRARQSVPAA